VKRRTLLKRISTAAAEAGVKFDLIREGGEHSVYQCGTERFTVPRHVEVNEITAQGILRHLESQFGRGWWR
jgi:mRNA interferase HicA